MVSSMVGKGVLALTFETGSVAMKTRAASHMLLHFIFWDVVGICLASLLLNK